MSYNYGLRLRNAKMCNAVRNNDYATAAEESKIDGWTARRTKHTRCSSFMLRRFSQRIWTLTFYANRRSVQTAPSFRTVASEFTP
jgi:hypothetical protein